jgi:predicted nucleic-acid-binding protein
MRAVDTNIVLRIITRDDAHQAAVADEFIENGAWVPTLALAEAAWVLASRFRLKPRELADAVAMLLNHNHLILQDSDAISEALTLFRAHPSLGFADCLMLELARKAGYLPFGTFDRALGKLPGAQKL